MRYRVLTLVLLFALPGRAGDPPRAPPDAISPGVVVGLVGAISMIALAGVVAEATRAPVAALVTQQNPALGAVLAPGNVAAATAGIGFAIATVVGIVGASGARLETGP